MTTRQSLLDMLEAHGREAAALDAPAMAAMTPILTQARSELNRDLAAWVAAHKGDERYTPQAYRQSLLAIQASMDSMTAHLAGGMAGALVRYDGIARTLANTHTAQEFLAFAATDTVALNPTVPVKIAQVLATGRRAPMARYETSAARYAGQVAADIRRELAVGVVRGENLDQLVARLRAHGGPRGPVALRGVAGQPGAEVEVIPEGLFARYEYWAERLVRTELAHAYNEQVQDIGTELRGSAVPDMVRRWDASFDGRVCVRCGEMNGKTTDPKTDLFSGDVDVPLHPNCRCRAGLWRPDWERVLDPNYRPPRPATLPPPPMPPPLPPPPPPPAPVKPRAPRKPRAPKPAPPLGLRSPPPATFASTAEAEAWGSVAYPHIEWDLGGIHPELLGETLKAFHDLATDWPEVAERLKYIGTYQRRQDRWVWSKTLWDNPGTYAHATRDGEQIAMNPHWYGRPAEFRAQIASDIAMGWHPPAPSIASVFVHEFGHQVENWLESAPQRSFLPYYRANGFGLTRETYLMFLKANKATKALGGYALTNAREAWAESFAAMRLLPRGQWTTYTRHHAALLESIRSATATPLLSLPSFSTYTSSLTYQEELAAAEALRKRALRMGIKI